jgi:trehalose/maltose hydrolase-like predicted phosphorylase
MHIASAGGTWQILVNGFGGLRILGGRVTLTPFGVPEVGLSP